MKIDKAAMISKLSKCTMTTNEKEEILRLLFQNTVFSPQQLTIADVQLTELILNDPNISLRTRNYGYKIFEMFFTKGLR